MASHNHLYRIRARRQADGQTEERIFLFRAFGEKSFLRKMGSSFPEWELLGEPELATPTPPERAKMTSSDE